MTTTTTKGNTMNTNAQARQIAENASVNNADILFECIDCQTPIEREGNHWVDVIENGTYDWCPNSYDNAHHAQLRKSDGANCQAPIDTLTPLFEAIDARAAHCRAQLAKVQDDTSGLAYRTRQYWNAALAEVQAAAVALGVTA